jgi:hypothetical protein
MNSEIKPVRTRRKAKVAAQYLIIHPDGKAEATGKLPGFCKSKSLDASEMNAVVDGTLLECESYRCYKIVDGRPIVPVANWNPKTV